MNIRRMLVAYALVNAVLYSILLPLWEGFDEPFHFGYVQHLANGRGLPDARMARLSRELEASILLTPASHVVKQNLPQVTEYTQYFSWPTAKRQQVRQQLHEIPPDLRWQPSQFINYEAQQAPLAYILLAIPERLFARIPLPTRVLILRIIGALAGAILLLFGAELLFSQLGIGDPYKDIALFCVLSCQMTWATLAHVANDWLAVPVSVWTLVAAIRYSKGPSLRTGAITALVLSLGLLTKAYFLAFVPLLLGVCALRSRWKELALTGVILCGVAGPWYIRNLVQYGVLTGMQQSRAGVDVRAVFDAAPALNWRAVIMSSAHAALWTGNNTFLTFSANTLNLIIGTSLVAVLLWGATRHSSAEWISASYCGLFVAALAYVGVVSYVYTHGAGGAPSPWYTQVLLAPALGLALLGTSRRQELGRFVAAVLVLLFGYVLAATYAVKLIPLYGGYEGRTSLALVAMLYTHRLKMLAANLDAIALVPATFIFVLASLVLILVGAQQISLIRSILTGDSHQRPRP